MVETDKLTLQYLLQCSFNLFPDRLALSYTDEKPITYRELQLNIEGIQQILRQAGIVKGDRVAIFSQNMPNWGAAYFAVTGSGAVAVPLLPDFSAEEVSNILNHAGARAIFVSQRLMPRYDEINKQGMDLVVCIDDFSIVANNGMQLGAQLPQGVPVKGSVPIVEEGDLASIIYTSGTTGRSKGVMLTHRNIVFNAIKVLNIQFVNENDLFLSVLPLSHAYENTLGLILPIMQGASVYYLKKPPTASVLLPALAEIRPTIMLTVPMIMEKIYRSQILGKFTANIIIGTLYAFPPLRKVLHLLAGKKLKKTFGGRLRFYGIGGAKLEPMTERFLREARFPYAVGYGLTETAPMLAGANPDQTVFQGVGPVMAGVSLKLEHIDPVTGIGEIVAKSDSVMLGYYKEPELTAEVLSADGWFRTGDLGCFDKKGNIHIKGRLKNMILTASGENIYPEDIESLINNFKYVVESVVIEKKGKLVALVHFDAEALQKQFEHYKEEAVEYIKERLNHLQDELIQYVNERVSKYARLQGIVIMPKPFEKTPTLKIKRYKYFGNI